MLGSPRSAQQLNLLASEPDHDRVRQPALPAGRRAACSTWSRCTSNEPARAQLVPAAAAGAAELQRRVGYDASLTTCPMASTSSIEVRKQNPSAPPQQPADGRPTRRRDQPAPARPRRPRPRRARPPSGGDLDAAAAQVEAAIAEVARRRPPATSPVRPGPGGARQGDDGVPGGTAGRARRAGLRRRLGADAGRLPACGAGDGRRRRPRAPRAA